MVADLLPEFMATVARCQPKHAEALRAAGVTDLQAVYGRPPLWGAAAIATDADGTFEFLPVPPGDGRQKLAVIVPIGWRRLDAPGWETLEDLAAFYLDAPGTWWVKRRACPLIGIDDVDRAQALQTPLRLHSTPLAWLSACGEGACVADWTLTPGFYLRGCPIIECDRPELARLLSRRIAETTGPESWHISAAERVAA